MNIMLGNISLENALDRLGIELPDATKNNLNDMRQMKAEGIQPGKWHCFDMPFMFLCGDRSAADALFSALSPFSDQMIAKVQIAVETKNERDEE